MRHWTAVFAALITIMTVPFAQAQRLSPEAQNEFFESNIRPVLSQYCWTCHNDSKMGGLRLTSNEDLLKGGNSGPAVVPGNPDKSLLITKIRQSDPRTRMPQGGAQLKDSEVAD